MNPYEIDDVTDRPESKEAELMRACRNLLHAFSTKAIRLGKEGTKAQQRTTRLAWKAIARSTEEPHDIQRAEESIIV